MVDVKCLLPRYQPHICWYNKAEYITYCGQREQGYGKVSEE